MFSKTKLFVMSFALAPMTTLAAAPVWGGESYFGDIVSTIANVVDTLIPVSMGLGFIAFFWYLFQYLRGDAKEKEASKSGLLWSVIAIVIMISIFGLASLLQGIFGAESTQTSISAPDITNLDAN